MNLAVLKNKAVQIVGLSGAEGSALALFLIKQGFTNLSGHDFKTAGEFAKSYANYHQNNSAKQNQQEISLIKKHFTKICFKGDYLKNINQAEIVFLPASWFRYSFNQPLIKLRQNNQIKFYNWYNLLLENFKGKLIGVTGTAGKGTVTNLLYQIIKSSKPNTYLIGDSWQYFDFNKILTNSSKNIVIAEINNRTLLFAKESKISPPLAIITNIFPNHLDDHQNSFKKYFQTKLELVKYQKPNNKVIILNSEKNLAKHKYSGRLIKVKPTAKLLNLIDNPYLKNIHYQNDALLAITAAQQLKINDKIIKSTLIKFKPRSGRMNVIAIKNKVTFIDDSASTRPKATIMAVKSLPKNKVILILEGSRKNPLKAEFAELEKTIDEQKVKKLFVSGQISKFITTNLKKSNITLAVTKNLTDSFNQARKIAEPGDTILLSPACESFGEFIDYRERSAKFIKLINSTKS